VAHHDLEPPLAEAQVRRLRVGDTVTLNGTLYGIRDATQIHMFDRGRRTRFDLRGHAVLHTAPNVKKVEPSAAHPAGYAPICVGTTTSARMERFTRPLMQQHGVRLIIGKGGFGEPSLAAFRELGGAYLVVVGGAAALETTWIEAIEDVDLDHLNPESLWRFRVKGFGPLLVGMDSHGGSLYREVAAAARARREAVLASLGVERSPD
jgi:L(+)-tartrate dehydratase beta subunit